ncbi:MAG: transcriptional regulator with only domain, AraC family, partial [Eubacterium sp.]|nr:transcriptional regulator with only domain, AraC family [Eubacterium sp.]
MFVEGLHEKDIFTREFPFRLEVNTEVDFTYPVHWHGAIELLYVEKNRFNITVNNSEFELEEGDILFIANGDTHGFSNQKNEGRRIFIQFDSSVFNALGSNNILKPLISNTFKISRQELPFHPELAAQILRIVDSYTAKNFGFQLFLSARIYDILSVISSYLVGRVKPESTQDTVKKMQGLDKLSEAFKYIEANYMNDISLSDIARAVGFSEFYFSRIFKDITEKNFSLYLNEYRIKQAEHYL